jgi:hypothetical protein
MTFKEWLDIDEAGLMGGLKAGWGGLKSALGLDTKQKMATIRTQLAGNLAPEERAALVAKYRKYLDQGYGDENVDTDLLNMPLGGRRSSPEELADYQNRDDVKNVLTRKLGGWGI